MDITYLLEAQEGFQQIRCWELSDNRFWSEYGAGWHPALFIARKHLYTLDMVDYQHRTSNFLQVSALYFPVKSHHGRKRNLLRADRPQNLPLDIEHWHQQIILNTQP